MAALPVHFLEPGGPQLRLAPIPMTYYAILYHACLSQHRQRNQDSVSEVAAECADFHRHRGCYSKYSHMLTGFAVDRGPWA